MAQAHRFGWELAHGEPPPADRYICHTCDNRLCQNPAHWFLGTNAENLADMRKKGRGTSPPRNDHRGERGPGAKLTARDVERIRALYATGNITQSELGSLFGIEQTNVSAIIRRKSWR